jgi:hypothetical protein
MSSINVRKLQIDLLLDHQNEIIEWFDIMWGTLYILETNVYHSKGGEIIFYKINDLGDKEWIFYHDTVNVKFWCNYINYWLKIKSGFCLDYVEIQIITKSLVDNALRTNILSEPLTSMVVGFTMVENALNSNVGIPTLPSDLNSIMINEVLSINVNSTT